MDSSSTENRRSLEKLPKRFPICIKVFANHLSTSFENQPANNPKPQIKRQSKVIPEPQDPTDVIALGPTKKSGLRLVCGDGSVLEMLRVQPAGKKAMDAKSFINGYPTRIIRWVKPEPAASD